MQVSSFCREAIGCISFYAFGDYSQEVLVDRRQRD
jgi:hypothetical protein